MYRLFLSFLLLKSLFASVVELNHGWSLIGTNIQDLNLSQTFEQCDTVWKYKDGIWRAVSPNGKYTSALQKANIEKPLDYAYSGDGFWVYCLGSDSMTFDGSLPSDLSLDFTQEGWHLKSLKTNSDMSVFDLFFEKSENISSVWKYSADGWKAYSPDVVFAKSLSDANIASLATIEVNEGFFFMFSILFKPSNLHS